MREMGFPQEKAERVRLTRESILAPTAFVGIYGLRKVELHWGQPMSLSNQVVSFDIRSSDARKCLVCENTKEQMSRYLSQATEKVICLIDDQDYRLADKGQKGFSSPLPAGLYFIPQYFNDSVIDWSYQTGRLYDSLIYIHGSTSSSEVGLTLTLAHELQHFVQYTTNHATWATNEFFQELKVTHEDEFRRSVDFPIEREARVVSKRVAIEMHGRVVVEDFIRRERDRCITGADVVDCDFLLSPEADVAYSAREASRALVRRFKPELIALQAQNPNVYPEVAPLILTSNEQF